jgi:serine protease Do
LKNTYLLITISSILLLTLSACIGMEEKPQELPAIEEITQEQLENQIAAGKPAKTLQDISALKRNKNSPLKAEKLEELERKAIERLSEEFDRAVEEKEFLRSYSLFVSMKHIEGTDMSEWEESDFFYAEAERYRNEGLTIPALYLFRRALEKGENDPHRLLSYAELALEEGHDKILAQIVRNLQEVEGEILGEKKEAFKETISVLASSRELLQGTVTIWVNRGVKIEEGVGYPDRVIGSGFFIDKKGYILTNYHVVSSEVDPEYEGFSRLFIRRSEEPTIRIPAEVVGWDPVFDIALLKAEVEPEYVFSLDSREDFNPGEEIFAIGSPGGLENTITSGIISAVGRRFLPMGDTMQVDVPINPGNSGGPLLNTENELIGVVFAGIEQFEGINFAIPSHWVGDIIPKMYEGGEITHPWLGLNVREKEEGLEITYALPGEPGERAGLSSGDIITRVNGKKYKKIRDLQQLFISLPKNTLLRVEWLRKGKSQEGYFVLGERPKIPIKLADTRDTVKNLLIPLFGMRVNEIEEGLFSARYQVRRVYQGGVADEVGISENDPFVIQEWKIDYDNKIALLRIQIKKRKAGFMENNVQLAAYIEVNSFI